MEETQITNLSNELLSLDNNNKQIFLEQLNTYIELFMKYECAILEIETKLNILDKEFSLKNDNNPIESISSRLKSPLSLEKKLKKLKLNFEINTIKENIHDIAGVRVICSFKSDVYKLVNALKKQSDITVINEKDYITNTKENGYRSYHLILSVPVFLSDQVENITVEVQFRTIAMDFWASLEHKLRYKKNLSKEKEAEIEKRLFMCAEISSRLDNQMQKIKEIIENDIDDINVVKTQN